MVHFKSLMLSLNWTPLFRDQEITPIMYQTCITRRVFNAYYSQIMLIVDTRDQQISNYYDTLTIIGREFHLYPLFWRFRNALKILDLALLDLKFSICRYVTLLRNTPLLKIYVTICNKIIDSLPLWSLRNFWMAP